MVVAGSTWQDMFGHFHRAKTFSMREWSRLEMDSATPAKGLSWVVDQTLNDPSYSPLAKALALVMTTFIVVSTTTEVLATVPALKDAAWMDSIEYVVIAAFTVEYLSRLVVHQGSRWAFVT